MRTLDCNLRDILRDAQLGAPETFMFARVDFSVNAQTPDPLAYIALAHRGGVPNGFKRRPIRGLTTKSGLNRFITPILTI